MAANGQLPASDLAPIKGGRLRKDCAAAWNALNVEARKQGVELRPTGSLSSYRDLAGQQQLWQVYLNGGNLAARPGTSNHGWGTAVDVATMQMRQMIDRIGERYGFSKKWSDAPTEWWHVVFQAGHYSGPDPGPDGQTKPPEPEQGEDMAKGLILYNADNRLEYWSLDANGDPWQQYEQAGGKGWSGWKKFGRGGANPFAEIDGGRDTGGRLYVFARTAGQITWVNWQNGANGPWQPNFRQF